MSLDCKEYFDKVRELWDGKEIVIVNFSQRMWKIDLFDNATNTVFIEIPMRHCFKNYDDILQKCCFFSEQNKVFVVTAGPMASVLAYDLTKMGERCIDIGKIAFEYAKWRGYHKLETFISQDTWQEKKRVWKYDENLKRVEVML